MICFELLSPSGRNTGWAFLVAQLVKNLPAVQETWAQPLGWDDRSPGGWHGNPLQYSCLENPVSRGVWRATIHGVAELARTERLSTVAEAASAYSGPSMHPPSAVTLSPIPASTCPSRNSSPLPPIPQCPLSSRGVSCIWHVQSIPSVRTCCVTVTPWQ